MAWCLLPSLLNLVSRTQMPRSYTWFSWQHCGDHAHCRKALVPSRLHGSTVVKSSLHLFKRQKNTRKQVKGDMKINFMDFWLPIKLCSCSNNEKIIQYGIPVAVLLTLQVGIKCKGRDERLTSYYRKRELTELWIYIKAPAPRNWYSQEMHFLGLFMSGTVSCNLLTNTVHGKNTHLWGIAFQEQFSTYEYGKFLA